MSTKIPLPNPENIVNYPANAKAVMVSARGYIRVVERHYYWDKEKKRGLEKREYIGYVVDNCYYSNDEYRRLFKRNGQKRLIVESNDKRKISVRFRVYLPVEASNRLNFWKKFQDFCLLFLSL